MASLIGAAIVGTAGTATSALFIRFGLKENQIGVSHDLTNQAKFDELKNQVDGIAQRLSLSKSLSVKFWGASVRFFGVALFSGPAGLTVSSSFLNNSEAEREFELAQGIAFIKLNTMLIVPISWGLVSIIGAIALPILLPSSYLLAPIGFALSIYATYALSCRYMYRQADILAYQACKPEGRAVAIRDLSKKEEGPSEFGMMLNPFLRLDKYFISRKPLDSERVAYLKAMNLPVA